jgi:Bacterial PH domain
MGGYTDKLQPKAAEVMQPGERLLGAIRTMPRGTTMGIGIGGAIGAVVADRQAKKANARQEEGSNAAAWPPKRSAVGLTDKRLLIFDYTAMGKPKSLIGEFPLDDVASLTVDKGLTNKVSLAFTDGSAVQLECAKLEKIDDFVTAFEGAKPGSTG